MHDRLYFGPIIKEALQNKLYVKAVKAATISFEKSKVWVFFIYIYLYFFYVYIKLIQI